MIDLGNNKLHCDRSEWECYNHTPDHVIQDNGKQVIVRINDRGPYSHADLDLSYAAFAHIQSTSKGNAVVCWRVVA